MSQNSIHITSPISLLQKQELLLRMEYEYEKETFRQQTETMGRTKNQTGHVLVSTFSRT